MLSTNMNWFRHSREDVADGIEDLAYPPSGGTFNLITSGIILPLVILWFAGDAWISQEALWFGNRGHSITVRGDTARSLAVALLGTALFMHFRWCWGLIPVYRVFRIGTTIGLLTILAGICFAIRYHFFYFV